MRKILLMLVVAILVIAPLSANGAKESDGKSDQLVVGFSQIGSESTWRTANSDSMISEGEKRPNITLKFSDAQQKQENQIKAIRTWINEGVDVIAISPIVASGWTPVLTEAKDAGIPIILVDRTIDSKDTSLWSASIGSDFIQEGANIANWLGKNYSKVKRSDKSADSVNVVQIEGAVGSSAAIDRKTGFEDALKAYPQFEIVMSQSGMFTTAGGKQVMEAFLKAKGDSIDVVYCHNDAEAMGAIQAIEEYGLKPGVDIIVSSIDGVMDAFKAMVAGTLNVTTECNPLVGPQVLDIAEGLAAGKSYPKRVVVIEELYEQSQAAALISSRKY